MRRVAASGLLFLSLTFVSGIAAQNLVSPMLPVTPNQTLISTSIVLIRTWAGEARKAPYRQDRRHQLAVRDLEALFERQKSAQTAATEIAALYSSLLKAGFKTSPVFQLWGMICEATRILGGDLEADHELIKLLNILSGFPDVKDKSGMAIEPGSGFSGVYWRDLPGLTIMFREYAMDIDPSSTETPDEGDWTPTQRATLLNVVTFGALYLKYGNVDIGMPFHAEVTLLEGVDDSPYQTLEQQRRAPALVPPAATWILLAGEKIYELCRYGNPAEERWYSMKRWDSWKRRFADIAANQWLTPNVREIASKAALEMGRVQSQIAVD